MKYFGAPQAFGFDMQWSSGGGTTAAEVTRGKLRVWVGARSVWGEAGGLEWTWIELLEHLARFWPYLILEEMDPLGLGEPLEVLWSHAQQRWATASEVQRADEEELLHSYLEAHDLAAGLAGVFPASVFVTREGNLTRVAARGTIVKAPLEQVETALVSLGDAIAERLNGLSDHRTVAALASWRGREGNLPASAAAAATGLSEADVIQLFRNVAPELAAADLASLRAPNELLAVARMTAGSIPVEAVERILRVVNMQPHVWTGPLDEVAAKLEAPARQHANAPPWAQGYALAQELRELLQTGDSHRVEPEALLQQWNIPIGDIEVKSRLIDALCVWGPRHGPAILVNRSGLHGRMNGRRATLAHEIAHLLLDRGGGLPVGEVLGGRVPQELEQRAKSFAAELLLPRVEAYRRFLAAADLTAELRALSHEYGVSMEIVAWQVRNGATSPLSPHLRAVLSSYVSRPDAF